MEYAVIIFPSANYSLWAARLLGTAGIERRMVPVPRDLGTDCGYCVRIRNDDIPLALDILSRNDVRVERIEKIAPAFE